MAQARQSVKLEVRRIPAPITNLKGIEQMSELEQTAMFEVLGILNRKLALAKTCGAYYKGTNKKTVDKLVFQINTLYKLCGYVPTATNKHDH